MRLPHSGSDSLDSLDAERGGGDALDNVLEIMRVAFVDDYGNKVVKLPVIHDSFTAMRTRRPCNPYGKIHLYRLRDLRFVWKHADARVERHGLERYDVEC